MNVTAQQRDAFRETGVIRLRRVVPTQRIGPARDQLLEELRRLRLRENGKWHTRAFDGVSAFQVAARIAQKLRPHPAFDAVIPAQLLPLLNDLAGADLVPAQAHPQLLVTPPQKGAWSVPEAGWHVDVAWPSRDVVPGVQVFVLLDGVWPRGGATMAIAGSHRSRELPPTPDRVVEMSGDAGDAFVMDMRVRHAPSLNATKHARLMLTGRFLNPAA